MKISNIALSFMALLASPAIAENMMGCVTDFDPTVDYFPDKVEVEHAEHWSVEYHNSYKIVRNSDAGTSYLLYQCGTPPPEAELDQHDAVASIPLEDVGLHYTVFIPYVELLESRAHIAAVAGQASWIYSPCVNKMVDEGAVTMVADINDQALLGEINVGSDLPYFVGVGTPNAFETSFEVSEWKETSLLAIFEWLKFFSLFLNQEAKANEIFDDREGSIGCSRENANLLSTDAEEQPVVLWGTRSDYCGGWDVARSCPNYYCELADTCSATLLTSMEGSIDSEACGRNYMTTEEFLAHGKDADIWIYAGHDGDFAGTLAKYPELLEFKSVKNDKVYDVSGQTMDAWFGVRKVEPATLIQDFCSVVGRENPASLMPHELTFLRHINDAIDSPPVCPEDQAPEEVPFLKLGRSTCQLITEVALPIPEVPAPTEEKEMSTPTIEIEVSAPTEESSASTASVAQILTFMLSAAGALLM